MTQNERRLLHIIIGARKIDPATVTVATSLDQIGISSLDALALAFDIENEFGVVVPDAELFRLKTVGDVFAGVERLLVAKERGPINS